MQFYIAGHSRDHALLLMEALQRMGHACTSRWISNDNKFESGEYTDLERRDLATMDEQDVRAATDGLVLLSEAKGHLVPGGKHVETGIAIALGRSVYIIGRRENVFHWHPLCHLFPTSTEFLMHVRRIGAAPDHSP